MRPAAAKRDASIVAELPPFAFLDRTKFESNSLHQIKQTTWNSELFFLLDLQVRHVRKLDVSGGDGSM